MEDGATPQTLGAIRTTKWRDLGERKHRLIGHSDLDHVMTWELIESNPPAETLAHISTLRCRRITESNQTFVEWSGEFSSGTQYDYLMYEKRACHTNLSDIRAALTRRDLPVLYHVHEGPSTRVAIVAAFLGIPLKVKLVTPDMKKLDGSTDQGGVVTKYVDNELLLLESGSTVMYLIEKYDAAKILDPFPAGTAERAKYLQWFFYSTSTIDHLLFAAYTQLFVVPEEARDNAKLEILKSNWNTHIVHELEAAVSNSKFLCGDVFTGADIMCGWSVYFAQTIGWLDEHPKLRQYLARLLGMEQFQRPFTNYSFPPFYLN
jgi:glutathione S-transferase